MADSGEVGSFIERDFSKSQTTLEPNHVFFKFEQDSLSSTSLSEFDLKSISTLPLSVDSPYATSNDQPCMGSTRIDENRTEYRRCSEMASGNKERSSCHSYLSTPGLRRPASTSLLDLTTDSEYMTPSPSVIVISRGIPNFYSHARSSSGTTVISGIRNALPDTLVSAFSPTTSYINLTISQEHPLTRVQMIDIDDVSSEENESSEDSLPRRKLPLQSRRGSELLPPSEIWITGGPSPGLYRNEGKVNGRPQWIGSDAKICWNVEAKAWLLVSREKSNSYSALAMLCTDWNNPCITSRTWRVVKNLKKCVRYNFYDIYAFRVDPEMVCTRYFGGTRTKHNLPISESTVVRVKRGVGIVRFIGPLEDKSGMFAGIELFSPTGIHNGTRKGLFYFEAKPKHGVFVRIPNGVKIKFGIISDKVATFIDNILATVRSIIKITEKAIERLVEVIILIQEEQTLFYGNKINVLGIILCYELLMP